MRIICIHDPGECHALHELERGIQDEIEARSSRGFREESPGMPAQLFSMTGDHGRKAMRELAVGARRDHELEGRGELRTLEHAPEQACCFGDTIGLQRNPSKAIEVAGEKGVEQMLGRRSEQGLLGRIVLEDGTLGDPGALTDLRGRGPGMTELEET